MKGAVLSVNPRAVLLDLTHQIPPQDLLHTSYFLVSAIPYFPAGVLHVVVVDPGVGTPRALLYVEIGGHRLLVPDNGCWTELAHRCTTSPTVLRLAEPRYWRAEISDTFHGRDILAPVAGHLSLGLDPKLLGPAASTWSALERRAPEMNSHQMAGQVQFVDDFGNLITTLSGKLLDDPGSRLFVGSIEVRVRVRTYAEAAPGTLVALSSSTGHLEIAVVQGNAAARLRVEVGEPVRVLKSRR